MKAGIWKPKIRLLAKKVALYKAPALVYASKRGMCLRLNRITDISWTMTALMTMKAVVIT